MWNTWTASPKSITTASSGARSPCAGASTMKSSSTGSPPGGETSMYPPAPSPVSSGSVISDVSSAASAASTALPPARSTSAPAWAVSGWPAATTPRSATHRVPVLEPRDKFGNVDVGRRARGALRLARRVRVTRGSPPARAATRRARGSP